MKTKKLFPCRTTDIVLHVKDYKDGMINGWLSHARQDGLIEIKSIPQFLFAVEEFLSQDNTPLRYPAFKVPVLPDASVATLRIQILFREHRTWQGCLVWEEQQLEASFMSVLELIEIIDEILGE